MQQRWRDLVTPRQGSATDRLLTQLMAAPVVSVDDVMVFTGASRTAAFAAVNQLLAAGVLRQLGSGARSRLFEAREVFAVLTDDERALATPTGDTVTERPQRHVPARNPRS